MFTARSKKVAFAEVENGTFNRMKGFTALTTNKNPQEYTRQYVDESFEVTDVVEYQHLWTIHSIRCKAILHDKLISIIDGEKIGDDAVVSIVVVDFTQEGATGDSFKVVKRLCCYTWHRGRQYRRIYL